MYGSIPQLGNWVVDDAYALSSYEYTVSNTNWFASLDLQAGTSFEYKYFKRNLDYTITWAAPPNMAFTVPSQCNNEIVQNDQWQQGSS